MPSSLATSLVPGFLRRHPLLAMLAALLLAIVVLVASLDLKTMIERYAGAAFGRQATIGALELRWGRVISLEATDVRIANAPGGSRPDMLRIARIAAEIDVLAPFTGGPWLTAIDVAGPDIVLERDAEGRGNWRAAGGGAPATRAPARTSIPAMRHGRLRDGRLTFRTSSGAVLRIAVADLELRSSSGAEPVALVATGAYNDTPVRLVAQLPSFDTLRSDPGPLAVRFTASTPATELGFAGTMTDPWAFEGVAGALRVERADLIEVLRLSGVRVTVDESHAIALQCAGTLTRDGDRWVLADASGRLMEDAFAGSFALTEGGRGRPDVVDAVARFERLELDPLLTRFAAATPADAEPTASRPDATPGAYGVLRLTAGMLLVRKFELAEFALDGRLADEGARVERLAFGFAGGAIEATASARRADGGRRVELSARVDDVDANRIAAMLGLPRGELAGRIAAAATIEAMGETLAEALAASRGHVVVAVAGGRIARDLLEKASTDLRALFRRDERSTRLSCLLGVVELGDGRATISRLRLETPVTTLVAGGRIDIARRRLDMVVQSVAASTGFFALDIPIRIAGPLTRPDIERLLGGSARVPSARPIDLARLPPDLRRLVEGNRCAR